MSRLISSSLFCLVLLSGAVVSCEAVNGQGILVVINPDDHIRLPRPIPPIWPRPPRPWPQPQPEPPAAPYKIDALEVDAKISDQVAKVQVSQSFVNTGSRPLEVSFIFPLPYDGAIDKMTLLVDGKEMPAKLLDAQEARRKYEEIVRKNRDPALLEWMGTGMFQTSVFPVPPGGRRTVALHYVQLCRNESGMTDFLFPLSTAKYTSQPLEKVSFRVAIESQNDIKNVYSPTHSVEIKRSDDRHAVVSYTAANVVPASDFRLFYDIGHGPVGTRVLTYRPQGDDEGYFLLLASPKIEADKQPPKKTVMLVIDRSGSMSGKKIEQVRAALKHVLDNLRDGDLFNVIAFDSEVEAFKPELQRYNAETRKAAIGFVDGIYAGGSTNISGALHTAMSQLKDSQRPTYIVFLTDGLPTDGETNEAKIVAKSKDENQVHARIFSFGVGYDVNARFLDKLVRENFGQSAYVRPDENIESQVARLYNRIESPVMTNVQIRYEFDGRGKDDSEGISRVYPRGVVDLFAGEQLVVVGRYRKPGAAKAILEGAVNGETQKYDFAANFVERSGDESLAFIEKLWAVRRVGEIIDEIDLKGKNDELVKELVELSTRHGILTPYTSFMADETTNIRDITLNSRSAGDRLQSLAQEGGAGGTAQRSLKGDLQNAYNAAPAQMNEPAKAGDSYGLNRFANSAKAAGGPAMGRGGAGHAYADPNGPAAAAPATGSLSAGASSMAFEVDNAAKDLSYGGKVQAEAQAAEQTLRNIGNRTFYRRGGQWIDSQVNAQQQQNARRVKQFSKEYFELSNRYGRTMSQYLAMDEAVVLNLGGEAYLIEP